MVVAFGLEHTGAPRRHWKDSVPIPRRCLLPSPYSYTFSKGAMQSPPRQHLGQQHTKENSGHEQKVPFTTSIKSLPCSATFSSSLACLLSLSHEGPYLFHQSPIAPTRSSPRMEYISTNCPCTSHISAMYWASCQSYPPVAFLLAPQAPVGLPHSQFLGLSPGTWHMKGGGHFHYFSVSCAWQGL